MKEASKKETTKDASRGEKRYNPSKKENTIARGYLSRLASETSISFVEDRLA
jgi:hypothetical protein